MADEVPYDGLLHYMVDHEETDDVLTTIVITYCGKRIVRQAGMDQFMPNKCPTCWPPGGMGPGEVVYRADLGRN